MSSPSRKSLPQILALKLIPMVAATGRLAIRENAGEICTRQLGRRRALKLWLEVRQVTAINGISPAPCGAEQERME